MSQERDSNIIRDNGYSPTMSEIAKRCGVSQSTVSRALHNVKGRQSDETRTKILTVAREMGYDPMRFQAARQLASIRHGNQALNYIIGFFFYHLGFSESNYLSRIQQGILSAVSLTEFEVLTSNVLPAYPRSSQKVSHPYRRGEVDGALAIEQDPDWRWTFDALRTEPNFGQRPIVGLISHLDGCSGVFADNVSAGYQALSHLLQLGHRHIVCQQELIYHGSSVQAQRLNGYRQACVEAALIFEEVVVELVWVDEVDQACGQKLIEYLKQHPEVTAIINANDQAAADVHRTLVSGGYSVPEDISMVSYDDTDSVTDGRGANILTTVKLPLVEVGQQGAELLIRRILGEDKEDCDIVLPVELIVRRSSAPPTPLRRIL